MMRNLGIIVLLLAVPLAAQEEAEDLSKFLPLAVGDSWTYEHVLQDKRNFTGSEWYLSDDDWDMPRRIKSRVMGD